MKILIPILILQQTEFLMQRRLPLPFLISYPYSPKLMSQIQIQIHAILLKQLIYRLNLVRNTFNKIYFVLRLPWDFFRFIEHHMFHSNHHQPRCTIFSRLVHFFRRRKLFLHSHKNRNWLRPYLVLELKIFCKNVSA
jgi:hypothetical protein